MAITDILDMHLMCAEMSCCIEDVMHLANMKLSTQGSSLVGNSILTEEKLNLYLPLKLNKLKAIVVVIFDI